METALALLAGIYFAAGVYLVLADRPVRAVLGLGVLAQAAVIAMLAAGRLTRDRPPILPQEAADATLIANPLAQAFVIVALAISLAAAAVLAASVLRMRGTRQEDA